MTDTGDVNDNWMMQIRSTTRTDNPAIADLIQEWDRGQASAIRNYSRSAVKREAEFVAELDGGIKGWIVGHHQSGSWQQLAGFEDRPLSWNCSFVPWMFVAKDVRRHGLGLALLAAFEQDAIRSKSELVVIRPDERGDLEGLRDFYRSAGYELHSFRKQPQESYIMSKSLRLG